MSGTAPISRFTGGVARWRAVMAVLAVSGVAACTPAEPRPTTETTSAPTPPPPAAEACLVAPPPPESPVYAFFTCGDGQPPTTPRPVPRPAQAADPLSRLQAAMIGLVGGPTEAERADGYTSFFSEETARAFVSASIDPSGLAIVDLADIRESMPNASTSAGSAALLSELNATVFQIEEVTAVEYRMGGSCDRFWEWL